MLKKQIMKKMFDDKFNIDKMRNQILLKNERKEEKNMNKIYKLVLPIVLLVVIGSVVFFTQNNFILESNNHVKSSIHINELEELFLSEQVLEVEEVDIEDIPKKFDFILAVSLPTSFKLERQYNLYTRSNIEVDTFDVVRDYVFEYKNANGSKIIISFSETGKPLKDYLIKEGASSKINETNVFISQYQKKYIVLFHYKNINFCIEAEDISIEELTLLLKSIVK